MPPQGGFRRSSDSAPKIAVAPESASRKASQKLGVTMDELKKHDGSDGTYWTAIHGEVYNMTEFLVNDKHPGGRILRTGAGRDSTCMFEAYHSSQAVPKVEKYLKHHCEHLGPFLDQAPLGDPAFWNTVSARVDAKLKETGRTRHDNGLALLEFGVTLGLFVTLVISNIMYCNYFAAALLGVVVSRLGFIMHAGCHMSTTDNPTINFITSLAMDVAGGSSTVWTFEHNVAHHCNPNELGYDNDAKIGDPLLKFHPDIPDSVLQRYQHITTFVLMSFGTIKWYFSDLFSLVRGNIGSVDFNASKTEIGMCTCFKVLKWVLAVTLPAYYHGLSAALTSSFITFAVAAHILENTFIVNHIQGPDAVPNPSNHWAHRQLEGTYNWSSNSTFSNWVSGGLNHQIEHHLFPSMSIYAYPTIAPVVKQTCEEFGIQYNNFNSFPQAWWAMMLSLKDMGSADFDARYAAAKEAKKAK